MSKGLSKEDLEQDILLEYSSRFMHYYENNKAAVVGIGIAIVAVIGLGIGYFVYSNQQEAEAQELLSQAEQAFMVGDYETALNGDDEAFTIGFAQIADNYGRTTAGNLASYYAAVSEFELGNFESALDYISDFSVPDGIVGITPLTLHATILSELERYSEAAEIYDEAAEWSSNRSTTAQNIFEAAIAYNEAGMNQEALERVERVLEEFPNSSYITEAQRLHGTLTQ
ncbi:MAG: tetratricopeptide repeat protein [Balneolaceae bacterium]